VPTGGFLLCTAFSSRLGGSCILYVNLLLNEFNSLLVSLIFLALGLRGCTFCLRVGCDLTLRGHLGDIVGLEVGGQSPAAKKDCQRQAATGRSWGPTCIMQGCVVAPPCGHPPQEEGCVCRPRKVFDECHCLT
jgi:hypothetical protein